MSEFKPLDLASSSLDFGRVVIEASAGTGKTYSLTVLAVRHIAETELTADQLLMVTFTKAATAELRHKTRERAQEALECLRTGEKIETWMTAMRATAESKAKAKKKLTDFISRFDEATITTIHGFCQIVLSQIGLNSPAPTNYTVQSDVKNIINQAITDALASRLAENPGLIHGNWTYQTKKAKGLPKKLKTEDIQKSLSDLQKVVDKILMNPGALVLPKKQPSEFATNRDSLDDEKKELNIQRLEVAETIAEEALQIVADVRRRCHELNIITYDDMVRLVAETLNPKSASKEQLQTAVSVAAAIANQYRMIMVDEFQDTDLSQWSIFKKIFEANSNNLTLITVGDPKQSIYRFRGADVQAYIDSVKSMGPRYELEINYRSDGALLTALETLLLNTSFDVECSDDAKFKKVTAAKHNEETKAGSKSKPPMYENVPGAPLELRYLSNSSELDAELGEHKKGKIVGVENNNTAKVNRIFWRDTANHVVELLTDGSIPYKESKPPGVMRAIKPSDIAILVGSHRDAEKAVNYLRESGVPAVRLKTSSVFGSTAAMHWLMFLGAIANPGKPQYVRAFALSWFGDSSNDKLQSANSDQVAGWQRKCAESSELLQKNGLAAVYMSYRSSANFLKRILGEPDGERNVTDLDHLAEILTSIPRLAQKVGATECYETLCDLVEESDNQNEEHLRRIEGDDDAVKVMTIHTSKGLQFPIVFLPTLYKKPPDKGNNPEMFSLKFNGDENPSHRIIDSASAYKDGAADWLFIPNQTKKPFKKIVESGEDRKLEGKKDRFSETMRLLYVALTRAEHKVIAYWSACGPAKGNTDVAMARVLYAHGESLTTIPTEKEALDALMASISKKSNGTIATIALQPSQPEPLVWEKPKEKSKVVVDVATFTRDPKSVRLFGFARWSYSGLAKALKGENVNDGGDGAPGTDESDPIFNQEDATRESADASGYSTETKEIDVHIKTEDAITAMPLFSGVAGASFGDAVHKVFEEIDPSAVGIQDLITEKVEAQFESWSEKVDKTKISEGILKSIDSPLGTEFSGKTLRSLGAEHRLAELSFDFRLTQDKAFKISEIGNLMLKYGELNSDLTEFANRLVALGADNHEVAGFMTGSIDAVFRIIDNENNARYIVADYKTNRLHDPKAENENPLISYHPENLLQPMIKLGFILQVLVYTVALHRYLKWREPEYDPDKHLGGAAYLFIRGMIGFETNESPTRPYGVYFWRPPTNLVLALDALFAGKPL